MSAAELSALQAKLGKAAVELPDLSVLSTDDMQRLNQLVDAAAKQQADTLRSATETALEHVPRLLRGAVKKIVLG